MAGDWIKMRGGLINSPKLIAVSKHLMTDRDFRDWITPGGGGLMNGQVVSDAALRYVTLSLLCVTWSSSREYGKALRNGDCLLPYVALSDIDDIANAPGIGVAMASVGWAVESNDPKGVILPKFFVEHNVAMTNAERQANYRKRKSGVTEGVTARNGPSVTFPLPEKRREEKNKKKSKPKETFTPPTVEMVAAYRAERQLDMDPESFVDHFTAQGWVISNGRPMKDWQAAARNWARRAFPVGSKKSTGKLYGED